MKADEKYWVREFKKEISNLHMAEVVKAIKRYNTDKSIQRLNRILSKANNDELKITDIKTRRRIRTNLKKELKNGRWV